MPNKFIPKTISFRVVIMKNDISERKSHGADLFKDNNKNNLHHAIGSAGINKLGILNDCIYTNVNRFRQNPYLKLISAIYNLSNHSVSEDNKVEDYNVNPLPIIT